MTNLDNKILKKKKLDKETTLLISQNEINGRIFVEFCSETNRLKVQKSFQNTFEGKRDSETFSKTIKNIKDLRKYFGVK